MIFVREKGSRVFCALFSRWEYISVHLGTDLSLQPSRWEDTCRKDGPASASRRTPLPGTCLPQNPDGDSMGHGGAGSASPMPSKPHLIVSSIFKESLFSFPGVILSSFCLSALRPSSGEAFTETLLQEVVQELGGTRSPVPSEASRGSTDPPCPHSVSWIRRNEASENTEAFHQQNTQAHINKSYKRLWFSFLGF